MPQDGQLPLQVRDLLDRADDRQLYELLLSLRPADVAQLLVELPKDGDRLRVFALLSPDAAARVVEELPLELQGAMLRMLPPEQARTVLARMSTDDLADLVAGLKPAESRHLLELVPEEAAEVRRLMQYPPDTAGGLMTPEFIRLTEDQTAACAIETIRRFAPDAETVYYLYVTDGSGRLKGVVSLRKLVVADPGAAVGQLMDRHVVSVPVTMDQEDVARVLRRYNLLAVPVIDERQTLLGVVTVDDVLDVINEETTEDIHRLGGSEPLEQPYLRSRVFTVVRARVSWLLLLFVLQSVTITIMRHYQSTLESVLMLSFFVPLLIGTAGNAGSQASTLVIRSMAVGELTFGDFFRVVSREAVVGTALGGVMAAATWLRARLLGSPPTVGYTVTVTVMLIVVTASVVGGSLPMIIKRLRLDPAVASSPLITTLLDATGLFIYFTVAGWILGIDR
ncbi:MAG: magnesium transporter [Firmicutes bacterium]|nr:magnesium transporter [Bacillota bacterium]